MSEQPVPAATPAPAPVQFRWSRWFAALALTVFVGWIADIFAMFGGFATHIAAIGAIVGLIPAAICVVLSRKAKRDGFAQGMIVGACLVAIIGGFCGALGAIITGPGY